MAAAKRAHRLAARPVPAELLLARSLRSALRHSAIPLAAEPERTAAAGEAGEFGVAGGGMRNEDTKPKHNEVVEREHDIMVNTAARRVRVTTAAGTATTLATTTHSATMLAQSMTTECKTTATVASLSQEPVVPAAVLPPAGITFLHFGGNPLTLAANAAASSTSTPCGGPRTRTRRHAHTRAGQVALRHAIRELVAAMVPGVGGVLATLDAAEVAAMDCLSQDKAPDALHATGPWAAAVAAPVTTRLLYAPPWETEGEQSQAEQSREESMATGVEAWVHAHYCLATYLLALVPPRAALAAQQAERAVFFLPLAGDAADAGACRTLCEQARRQRDAALARALRSTSSHTGEDRTPGEGSVSVEPAESLSYARFYTDYAQARRPVVIRGGAAAVYPTPLTRERIRSAVGPRKVTLRCHVPDSVEWARLEAGDTVTVEEYLAGTNPRLANQYLFDWSLPQFAPELLSSLSVPKWFAQDLLQRLTPGSRYRDAWPSLFVAPAGLRSDLHVDAFGSHFWMALFEGVKRWTFYKASDVPLLYPDYSASPEPVFASSGTQPEVFVGETGEGTIKAAAGHVKADAGHGTARAAAPTPYEVDLKAGDLLFVPAGCPHTVVNMTPTVALSGNYVDASNLGDSCRELSVAAFEDPAAADVLAQLQALPDDATQPNFDRDAHVPWPAFKATA